MHVVLVTNIPTAYRTPLYELLDAILREDGGRLTVVYGARIQRNVQWPLPEESVGGVDSIFLRHGQLRIRGRTTYINPMLWALVRRLEPDVAILGGYAPWMYPCALWCRVAGVPYLIWTGETVETARLRGSRRMRRLPLVAGASGFLAYGPAAAEYLASVGVERDAVTVVGNGIDIEAYRRRVDDARLKRDDTRRRLGVGGRIVLTVGGKNLALVERSLAQLDDDVRLLVVGTGRRGVRDRRVHELGRLPPSEMPHLYAVADALVHLPVVDLWPHAINEALAGGLPVVATPSTGAPDDIFTGPGCAIVPLDPSAVGGALVGGLEVGHVSSEETREAVRAPLRPWGVDRMAERMARAAHSATVSRTPTRRRPTSS